jgi:hypothetical protein
MDYLKEMLEAMLEDVKAGTAVDIELLKDLIYYLEELQ